jgi:hypothetical protein
MAQHLAVLNRLKALATIETSKPLHHAPRNQRQVHLATRPKIWLESDLTVRMHQYAK